MIDPSIIDDRILTARARDNNVTQKLLGEIARLAVVAPFNESSRSFDLNSLTTVLRPARFSDTGMNPNTIHTVPEPGSYAYQLWSAICFVVDARAELKLLELIASQDFYAALMRSAAEVDPATQRDIQSLT
jgi:hypothetical protein